MIRHIVMWDVRGASRDEKLANIAQLTAAFLALRGRIPGLLHLEIGVDTSCVDYACDVVLLTDFASQEALDAYGSHPEHLRVRQELGDMRIARHQVDYAIPDIPRLP